MDFVLSPFVLIKIISTYHLVLRPYLVGSALHESWNFSAVDAVTDQLRNTHEMFDRFLFDRTVFGLRRRSLQIEKTLEFWRNSADGIPFHWLPCSIIVRYFVWNSSMFVTVNFVRFDSITRKGNHCIAHQIANQQHQWVHRTWSTAVYIVFRSYVALALAIHQPTWQ